MCNQRFRFLKNISTGFAPARALQREASEVLDWRRRADLTRSHPVPLRREVKLFMIAVTVTVAPLAIIEPESQKRSDSHRPEKPLPK
jgi:hypothetical protein